MIDKRLMAFCPIYYRILFAALLVGIAINGYGYIFGIHNVGGWHWFLVVETLILLACLNYAKISGKIISGIVLVLVILIMIPLVGAGQIEDFLGNYIYWLRSVESYNPEWVLGYQLMQTTWISIVCYGIQILTESKRSVKDILAILLLIGLLACMFWQREISHIGVALAIGYIVLCYVERIRFNWKKKKGRDKREYTLFLVPFFIVYVFILACLPAREEPYQWEMVRNIYSNLKEKATIWWENINRNGAEDFGFTTAGFSEDGKLMGGFAKADKTLMTIQGDITLVTNIYLRGKTFDLFDGREWKKSVEENMDEYPLDMLEILYAIRRYDKEYETNYIHAENAKVRYEHFNTGFLFTPLKRINVRDMEYEIRGSDFVFGEQKGYSTEYSMSYYQLNLNTPEFMKMMEVKLPDNEELWETVARGSGNVVGKLYTLEDLEQYRADMKNEYYQEICLTEKSQKYIEEITVKYETEFQRMKAIEEELSSYVYTRNPGKLPEWIQSQEDFLDYFLLESKQGYCTHFATAFVLLARAEGLPARYVEGFCVPINQERVMEVSSGMAHAWPEVYFEGIGWIPFEPTPGYAEIFYDAWEVRKPKEESESKPAEEEEATDSIEEEIETEELLEEELEEESAEQEKGKRRFIIILKGAMIIVLVCLVVLFLERILQKRRYLRMNTEQQFLLEVKRNLWLFSRLGYKREETETLSELQEKINIAFPQLFEEKEEFVFLRGYQEYLYRKEEVTKETLEETIAERKELLLWVKGDNRLRYYTLLLRMLISPSF